MLEIFWLDSALNDLVRLRAFLADVNPAAASNAAISIKKYHSRFEFIEDF